MVRAARVLVPLMEIITTCIFCEGSDLFGLPAHIAETTWPVCHLCASAGRALLDEGAIQPVLHCLHLTAMEIEQFATGYAVAEDKASRKWLFRLQRQFARDAFREVCPCKTCMGDVEFTVVHDLHARFGLNRETFADTMPLDVLRSMKDGQRIKASDGTTWRAVDEIARRLEAKAKETRRGDPGPLAHLAAPRGLGEGAVPRVVGNPPKPCPCAYCQRGPGVGPHDPDDWLRDAVPDSGKGEKS